MANMPSCNLLEIIISKWLQQSHNYGNDLFAASCDNKIKTIMQMINWWAYLKYKLLKTSLLRQELKLRAATHNNDFKKIVHPISLLSGMEKVTTNILHLEGKEIFGSTKQKLDSYQVLMAILIDLTRPIFHNLEYRLGPE